MRRSARPSVDETLCGFTCRSAFGNVVNEFVQFTILQVNASALKRLTDFVTRVHTLLWGEQDSGCCANSGATDEGSNNAKSFHSSFVFKVNTVVVINHGANVQANFALDS